MNDSSSIYDVAILGSGLAGGTLGAILARHGFKVLILEAGVHPRFAVGESITPEFGARSKIMAHSFDVPELEWLSTFQLVRHKVSGNCGIKRNFSFLHHAPGRAHEAADSCQFQTMTYPLGPDWHAYRPDLDTWLTALAIKYGADYRERTMVDDVEFDADGATVIAGKLRWRARFVVDGTGYRSVLAKKFPLREENVLRTDSRSIFTHMVGVKTVAEARAGSPKLPIPSPPDQGTCHHIFDCGWFWIIPFNNHRLAVNPLCSVGVTVDRRKHPDNDRPAEEEFFDFVNRFPTLKRQFEGARATRGWTKTSRIQYQSARLAGDRWLLLPHAAGFIDPLFSGGMPTTLVGVQEAAHALMPALRENDFRAERFAAMEQGARENIQALDKVVHGSYVGFRSFELFNAWYRFWAVGSFHGSAALIRLHLQYSGTGDRKYLDQVYEVPYRRLLGTDHPRVREMIDEGYAVMLKVEAGEIGEKDAIDALYGILAARAWIPPQFHITDRSRTALCSFTAIPIAQIILWGKRHAPADMRNVYYDVGPGYYNELMKSFAREAWRSLVSLERVVWGAHFSRGRT